MDMLPTFSALAGAEMPTGSSANLKEDIGETTNLYAKYPEKVAELTEYINAAIQDIGNTTTVDAGARPAGDAGQ